MSQIKGGIGTYNASTTGAGLSANQQKGSWDNKIYLLNPNAVPFSLLMSKMNSQKAEDPRINWFEDDYLAEYDTVTNNASTGTTFTVVHREYFSDDDLIYIPSTGEVARVNGAVSATGAGNITVERGIGGSAVAIDGSGTAVDIFIIGNASAEFADIPEAKVVNLTEAYNYCQIFKTQVPGISGTVEATDLRTGDEEKRQKAKYAVEHAKKHEKTAFFGMRHLIATGAHPKRFAGGLVPLITTNVLTSVGLLSEGKWDHWLRDFLQNGSDKKVVFISPLIASIIDQFAKARLTTYVKDSTYGIWIKKYVSSNGQVTLIPHKTLLSGPLGGMAVGVDLEYCKVRPLRKTELKQVDNDNLDGKGWYFQDEIGFQFIKESCHALMTGVTGRSSNTSTSS